MDVNLIRTAPSGLGFVVGIKGFNIFPTGDFLVEVELVVHHVISYRLDYMWWIKNVDNFLTIVYEPRFLGGDVEISC